MAVRRLGALCSTLLACGSCTAADDGDTRGEPSWLPEACSLDESPFWQPECLDALRLACNALEDEGACAAAPTLQFDGNGIACSWAEVVAFSDVATCSGVTQSGRCEASVGLLGCPSPCTVIPSRSEIVVMCGGPLGAWSAIDSESDYTAACAADDPMPQPALCECATVACE